MTCCRYPSESECPAWDAWANPVAETNDPSSLVSEYAACGVWRPHTVLPFSRMSLVAYLRGWVSVCGAASSHRLRGGMRGWGVVDGGPGGKCFAVWDWQVVFRRGCSLTGSESDSQRSDVAVARIVDVLGVAAPHGSAGQDAGGGGTLRAACPCYICGTDDRQRSDITRARSVDVLGVAAPHGPALYGMRLVECMHGRVRGYWLCVVMQSVWEMVGRIAQAREVWRRRHCGTGMAMLHLRHRFSPRSDGTLARIVDVLGVAAPHGSAGT
ncbi:hypothetical protein TGRUB_434020 [Toxoplasma gondii RUB]|uniref:Uncharacterized protein n=1 Tax=Toxoplasma gondii RUB TaxID=935652 RepID=A0A086LJ18_TOXGO|nr:hypothetical protein TGRUB_434020 [Toxoplasma gondii RUB]